MARVSVGDNVRWLPSLGRELQPQGSPRVRNRKARARATVWDQTGWRERASRPL